jgi:hypothetical protein
MLVAKGIFEEEFVSFLLVEHTHEDINATFGNSEIIHVGESKVT